MKKPKLKRDWVGRFVRLKRAMQTNGGTFFEAGEILEVYENWGGLKLQTIKYCPECSRRFRHTIKSVNENDVELLPEDWKP